MHVSVEGSVGLVVLHNRPRNISADSKRINRNINCKQIQRMENNVLVIRLTPRIHTLCTDLSLVVWPVVRARK